VLGVTTGAMHHNCVYIVSGRCMKSKRRKGTRVNILKTLDTYDANIYTCRCHLLIYPAINLLFTHVGHSHITTNVMKEYMSFAFAPMLKHCV
jgi:hypothetical protein